MEKGTFQIYANVEQNRLYLSLHGHLTGEVTTAATHRTLSEASKLQPGFDVITDVTEFTPGSLQDAKQIMLAKTLLQEKGAGRIIPSGK
jgi:hypothetical protein